MSSLNRCSFIGRLGKDPEVKNLQDGGVVANFSMACSETWKDKQTGEKKEKTEWVNCVAWGSLATIISKYVHKGDLIFFEGKFTTRSWEKDGVKRYTTEILGSNIVLLGSKGGSTQQSNSSPAVTHDNDPSGYKSMSTTTEGTDDLPF